MNDTRPPVHLLHIGKTGGTAIQHALRPLVETGPFSVRLHGHAMTLRQIPPGERTVLFLRHPLTRFVSGFYSRQRQGLPRHYVPWRPEEAEAYARFPTANTLAAALSSDDPQERASTKVPWRCLCLPKAMAGKLMLTARGCPSTVRLGASTLHGALTAHAWLEAGGSIITGEDEMHAMTPFTAPTKTTSPQNT
jgi:hypothetical protein